MTPLLSQAEAARILGVSTKTLNKLELAHVAIGERKKYHPRDLRSYMAKQRRAPCPSTKEKTPPATPTISNTNVIGFAEAQKHAQEKKRAG